MFARIARRFARTPFGIGVAIGIIFCVPFQLLPAAHASGTPTCRGELQVPPEVQEWLDKMCQVRSATLNDGAEPSAAYLMLEPVQRPGFYKALSHDMHDLTFEAVWTHSIDLKAYDPELLDRGVELVAVAGRLRGTAGSINVGGLVADFGNITNDQGRLLMISNILSESDLAEFAHAERIRAGVRVVDNSGRSHPLAKVQDVNWLSASPTDLATLHCGCENPTSGGESAMARCVREAYEDYHADLKTAEELTAACMVIVVAGFAACMAVCAALVIFGPAGWVATAICAAACLAEQVIGSAACIATLAILQNAARRDLERKLARCGVVIAQD